MHSSPKSFPALFNSDLSQVAASAVPHGKQAAGTPAKNFVPRMPFGPSVKRMDGTLCLGMGNVCQKSTPIPKLVTGFARSRLGDFYLTEARFSRFVLVETRQSLRQSSFSPLVATRPWWDEYCVSCIWTAKDKSTQTKEEKTSREERKI
jgi:hypothetical protein